MKEHTVDGYAAEERAQVGAQDECSDADRLKKYMV
jgi:hypothetical protein